MEKTPASDGKIAELIEDTAHDMQESARTVHECKQTIARLRDEEQRFGREFRELCADLNPKNPDEARLLAQCRDEESKYARQMTEKLRRLEAILVQLEESHVRNLRFFEEAKAIKRQKDYGISGTAH